MLAALIDVPQNLGYPILFLLVGIESAGVPLPGETALIIGGLAASQGRLSIAMVIVVAASAAIIGDNVGFLVGRRAGRALLSRPGRFADQRLRVLQLGEPFFERHGGKTVFIGRWITGLRVWASWLAGASGMRWPTFLFFNAAGGAAWATTVALAAYFGGRGIEQVVARVGLYGGIVVGAALVALVVWLRRR